MREVDALDGLMVRSKGCQGMQTRGGGGVQVELCISTASPAHGKQSATMLAAYAIICPITTLISSCFVSAQRVRARTNHCCGHTPSSRPPVGPTWLLLLQGRVADAAGIQFQLLNASRGPAVHGPRAQMDRDAYKQGMQVRGRGRGCGWSDGGWAGAGRMVQQATMAAV